jgi:hypothetical protein
MTTHTTPRYYLTPCIGSTEQKSDGIRYIMAEPSYIRSLVREAVKSGNTDTFSEEVIIHSKDGGDNSPQDSEVYVARFDTHASWGLRLDIDIDESSTQTLWLEFVRDAN